MSAIGDTANGTHTCDSICTTCHGTKPTKKPTKKAHEVERRAGR